MNYKLENMKLNASLLVIAAAVLFAAPSHAVVVDLMAVEGTWESPGGDYITMWGFAEDTLACPTGPVTWDVGPEITVPESDATLTINLRNCLAEPVSIVIPGLGLPDVTNGTAPLSHQPNSGQQPRKTAFVEETAQGGTATYSWSGIRMPGTYLYQSGSFPAKQVQMGLYGAVKAGTYANTSGDVTLLYSEIDPALHDPAGAATPLGYKPRYFLVNGDVSTADTAVDVTPIDQANQPVTNQPAVLRFLNAGLDFHVPTLNGGYMSLRAEDGHQYPFSKTQYSVNLAAGKTVDAHWVPATGGIHVIYDRRGNGMYAALTVSAGTNAPVAFDDGYTVTENTPLAIDAPGVLDNDTGADLTAILVSPPSNGLLSPPGLNDDGSFTYTPYTQFRGIDSFSYKANNGVLDSNIATVTLTVGGTNTPPVAVADNYTVSAPAPLEVLAPGVLENDLDGNGDTLTVSTSPVSGPVQGSLMLNSDGSFTYTPYVGAQGLDSFEYRVCDVSTPTAECPTAKVTLDITAAENSAPVAYPDSATAVRNGPPIFINLTANDTDVDGNLKDAFGNVDRSQITIDSPPTKGSLVVLTNGVNYTPDSNKQGTDTFSYTVKDIPGVSSNSAQVTVLIQKN